MFLMIIHLSLMCGFLGKSIHVITELHRLLIVHDFSTGENMPRTIDIDTESQEANGRISINMPFATERARSR